MELGSALEGIKDQLETIYRSPGFPVIWLAGFAVFAGFSNDPWWLLPGVVGFGYWLIWKTRR